MESEKLQLLDCESAREPLVQHHSLAKIKKTAFVTELLLASLNELCLLEHSKEPWFEASFLDRKNILQKRPHAFSDRLKR